MVDELDGCVAEARCWGVSISNIDQGQLLVFADRVMVTGPTFARCHDLASVVSAARIASEQFDERQNGPLRRQLEYLKRLFPAAMKEARASTYSYLATFDGYQVHEGNAVWVLQTKNDDELRLDTEYAPLRVCRYIRRRDSPAILQGFLAVHRIVTTILAHGLHRRESNSNQVQTN